MVFYFHFFFKIHYFNQLNRHSSHASTKKQPPAAAAATKEPIKSSSVVHQQNKSIFDLRTSHGQLLFLFVTIAISTLVQLIPLESLINQFIVTTTTVQQCPLPQNVTTEKATPIYWTYGRSKNSAHLKHVHAVLNRLGLTEAAADGNNQSEWDLLWAHDYPFRALYPSLHNLQSHQMVNHFPACGFLTNKVDLATTPNLTNIIPKAFKLPQQRDEFIAYATENPHKLFVQKHNQHRHIFVRTLDEIDFANNDTFIQEFVQNPLLVGGHKFDIGVYVTITSVNPLRVYMYTGDILFRYCSVKYYPFDAKVVDKYIVGDDYTPTWEIPELADSFTRFGYGMKESFDGYMRQRGRDPTTIWQQVEEAIRAAIVAKERHIVEAVSLIGIFTIFLKIKYRRIFAVETISIEKEFL